MDEITKGLKDLIDSKDIINWKLAEELVENLDRKYKFYLLYFMKKRIPRSCAQCDTSYSDNVIWRFEFIMNYNAKNNLTTDRIDNRHIDFNEKDSHWINQYIKGTELENIQRDPCCPEYPYHNSKREDA